jgi:hypothetical protein
MNSEVMYLRKCASVTDRSHFSFAEEVARKALERQTRIQTCSHLDIIHRCSQRDDIKPNRPHSQGMRKHSIDGGWRRIDVDGKILEVATQDRWNPTLGKVGTIQNNAGVWSYMGKRDILCIFFENGNYLPHYRVTNYIQS